MKKYYQNVEVEILFYTNDVVTASDEKDNFGDIADFIKP